MGRANRSADKKITRMEKVVSALELPKTVIPGMSNIELTGNREAAVEGCGGIVRYDDDVIKLSVGKLVVCFYGNRLTIRNFNTDRTVIEGEIVSVEFLT